MGVADKAGKRLNTDPNKAAVPTEPRARQLLFDIHIPVDGEPPTPVELALIREISCVEHALRELYPDDSPEHEARFRPFFVRLFYIAQLALEGDVVSSAEGTIQSRGGRLSDAAAKAEVKAIAEDLIEDEAPRVKSRHLREHATRAGVLGVPALLAYVLFALTAAQDSSHPFVVLLHRLHVVPSVAANFMLLWFGTMVGVCLSYAFRTTEFAVADLTRTGSDHLPPSMRLAITGALAVLLALFALAGLGDVEIGSTRLSALAENPMLALVVGAILGIGEQKLAGTVATKAGGVFGGAK
jgi:hypothetical protein